MSACVGSTSIVSARVQSENKLSLVSTCVDFALSDIVFFYHFHILFFFKYKERNYSYVIQNIYLLFHFLYLFDLEGVFASVNSLWYLQVYGVCMCNICKCSVSQSLVRKEIMRSVRKWWACCTRFFFLSLTHTRILFFCVYKKEIIDR